MLAETFADEMLDAIEEAAVASALEVPTVDRTEADAFEWAWESDRLGRIREALQQHDDLVASGEHARRLEAAFGGAADEPDMPVDFFDW